MTTPAPPAPDRQLRLPAAGGGWKQTVWVCVGILMFGAVLVAAAVYTAPVVLSDWQVRDTARPVADARVTDGQCSTRIVLHDCNATLTLKTASGTLTRRVNYVFTGMHLGDYSIRVMADPARPDLVTTDLGLDQLWNRTITLLAGAALLLAFIVLPILGMIRNRRSAA